MDFAGKNVLVCGIARSGIAAANLLIKRGAHVTLQDMKAELSADPLPNVTYIVGQEPDEHIKQFHLIVISPGISIYKPFVQMAQALGIPVWGEAELAYRCFPCPMIAITGTNGKTTVTTLVGEILKKHNTGTKVAGNIGIPMAGLVDELREEDIVVAEISSFQLETAVAFRPKISAVLNMTEDHLDRHGNMRTYIAMKARIFANQQAGDYTVLNYENAITREMTPPEGVKVVHFSSMRLPRISTGVYLRDASIYAKLNEDDEEQFIAQLMHIRAHPENALAATAICLCAGVPIEVIAEGLKSFKGVTHRLEFVETLYGVDYYNDSKATNTDAAIQALKAMGRPVVLIGGGYDKQTDFTPWVEMFPKKVKHAILIGQTAQQIAETCDAQGFTAYEYADSMENAVKRAAAVAAPADCVVLSPACASFGMFNNFEERGEKFKELVRKLP
ncbi:MAG: UDP-N-acetylmuramoyl-L-alanine--D-glutamate ligase [Defluviitaleaceae bacterium]|nr:UDP-N-acetylmuramoyl-L-alanine--D-glutamate ligase [Defluviitaleaceae bacterium]MCL2275441.1 UDP-N-acetylmuramoyl-L-alanine--D-glutamate ligase [Defluviitaleaceae bacterium]